MNVPIIQIAGIRGMDEAMMLARAGVTDLGFPLRLDVHEEDMDEAETALVAAALPPGVRPVLITYLKRAEEILALCRRVGVWSVQLHGDAGPQTAAELKKHRPDMRIIKSLVVRQGGLEALEKAVADFTPHADAFLTDTYDPATGARGATGLTHDWDVSRRLVSLSPLPIILAGGLNPGNVRRAAVTVRPAGVDAHTGVEGPDGFKDPELAKRFVHEALAGFREIDPCI
jgi:phosphoribosylanthranilate isomerase